MNDEKEEEKKEEKEEKGEKEEKEENEEEKNEEKNENDDDDEADDALASAQEDEIMAQAVHRRQNPYTTHPKPPSRGRKPKHTKTKTKRHQPYAQQQNKKQQQQQQQQQHTTPKQQNNNKHKAEAARIHVAFLQKEDDTQ